MLCSLHIENVAVIKQLDLTFPPQGRDAFFVLTGETGAGKSIIIDSINFLLGYKGSKEMIRSGESKAFVSALFESVSKEALECLNEWDIPCEDGSVIIQKTITLDGKISAKVNGRSVTQSALKTIGSCFVTIHGQNENIKMASPGYQMSLLDTYAHNSELLAEYRALYDRYKALISQRDALKMDKSQRIREKEILEHQIEEIDKAKLKPGCEELYQKEIDRLNNLEKIQKHIRYLNRLLSSNEKGTSAVDLLEKAGAALTQLADILPDLNEDINALEEMQDRIREIAAHTERFDTEEENPVKKIDRLEGLLDAVTKLKKKYGSTVESILEFRNQAAERLDLVENLDGEIEKADKQIEDVRSQMKNLAQCLTKNRSRAAEEISYKVKNELTYLDMPNIQFRVLCRQSEVFLPNGLDQIEFLIAPNTGLDPMPLGKIASGGELSRIMLAMKTVLLSADSAEAVIFDEIDAGVSGKTARKVGLKLKELSQNMQVLCVTHSAQIASLSPNHIFVSKTTENGSTETQVRYLDYRDRVEEIARILGGIHITDTQRKAAEDLINP